MDLISSLSEDNANTSLSPLLPAHPLAHHGIPDTNERAYNNFVPFPRYGHVFPDLSVIFPIFLLFAFSISPLILIY
jgi:hypothetical protein